MQHMHTYPLMTSSVLSALFLFFFLSPLFVVPLFHVNVRIGGKIGCIIRATPTGKQSNPRFLPIVFLPVFLFFPAAFAFACSSLFSPSSPPTALSFSHSPVYACVACALCACLPLYQAERREVKDKHCYCYTRQPIKWNTYGSVCCVGENECTIAIFSPPASSNLCLSSRFPVLTLLLALVLRQWWIEDRRSCIRS